MKTYTFQITIHGDLAEEMNLTANKLYMALCRAFPLSRMSEWEVNEGMIGCVKITDDDIKSLRAEALSHGDYAMADACLLALSDPGIYRETARIKVAEAIAWQRAQK